VTLGQILLLALAGAAGGVTNALAGGATFFTFPAMIAVGLPPVVANASNAVALWPASVVATFAQAREIASIRRLLPPLLAAAFAGSAAGAALLLNTSDRTFLALVPFLLLAATLLFAVSPRLLPYVRARRPSQVGFGPRRLSLMGLCAVYGGYFGAGMGIMMMAGLSLSGVDDVRVANALKNLLAGVINGVAGRDLRGRRRGRVARDPGDAGWRGTRRGAGREARGRDPGRGAQDRGDRGRGVPDGLVLLAGVGVSSSVDGRPSVDA
jgi:uncharacterized membrane protein YfcA